MEQRPIHLNFLRPSTANVRALDPKSLKPLIASIKAMGLINPLVVRGVPRHGNDGGFWEIVAGNRRLAALNAIFEARKGSFGKASDLVPCVVIEAGDDEAMAISLAENVTQLPMTFIEQFDAFKKVIDAGGTVKATATAFGVTKRFVEQRLALASVIPEVREAFVKERMDIETLQIIAGASPALQTEFMAWNAKRGQRTINGYDARRFLEQNRIPLAHAIFDVALYDGPTTRDLFAKGDETYVIDLDQFWKLQNEALGKLAEAKKAEGWRQVHITKDWTRWHHQKIDRPLKPEIETRIEAYQVEIEQLNAGMQSDVERKRIDELDDLIGMIEADDASYDPIAKDRADVYIVCDASGRVEINEGYLTNEEARKRASEACTASQGPSEDDPSGEAMAETPKPEITAMLTAWVARQRKALMLQDVLRASDRHIDAALAATIAMRYSRIKVDAWRPDYHIGHELPMTPAEASLLAMRSAADDWCTTRGFDPDGVWEHHRYGKLYKAFLADQEGTRLVLTAALVEALAPEDELTEILAEQTGVDARAGGWAPSVEFFEAIRAKNVLIAMLKDVIAEAATPEGHEEAVLRYAVKSGKSARLWLIRILVNREAAELKFFDVEALDRWLPRWHLGRRYLDTHVPDAGGAPNDVGEPGSDKTRDEGGRGEDEKIGAVAAE